MRIGDLDALKSEFDWLLSQVSGSSKDEIRDVIKRIDNAPTVDAVPVVHGKWKKRLNEKTCSECKFIYYSNGDMWNYCPNCGAKMDGERRNDENS